MKLNDKYKLFKADTYLMKKMYRLDGKRDNVIDIYWIRFLEEEKRAEVITLSDIQYIEPAFYNRPHPFKKHRR
jgi:hypothetical protein